MKKIVLLLVAVAISMSLSACKLPDAALNSSSPSLSSEAAMAPVNPELSGYEAHDGTKYMKWTYKEWNTADAEEKRICAITYMILTDPDIVKVSEDAFNTAIDNTVDTLDKKFRSNSDRTLEEFT